MEDMEVFLALMRLSRFVGFQCNKPPMDLLCLLLGGSKSFRIGFNFNIWKTWHHFQDLLVFSATSLPSWPCGRATWWIDRA